MQIDKYTEEIDIDGAIIKGEPMLAVISFDGSRALVGHADECMEHHILLKKMGLPSQDIDKYFRIVFDDSGADWTFVCPPDYMGIGDRTKRITAFYMNGVGIISAFMAEMGLFAGIKIPKRYRRHAGAMITGD
ncbi:MAG: hypothetical protein FWB85_03460 [Chitinispirillia bacterium]|nr:hypothetical protein [Chitinispirillia bacterium]MCL2241463.1 hypothetical protein [Chitinispirillia bacterium]